MHMIQKKTFTQKLKMINNIMRVAPTEEGNDQQEIKPEKPKTRSKKKNRDHKDQRTRKEEKEQTIILGIAKRGGRRRKKKKKREGRGEWHKRGRKKNPEIKKRKTDL